MPVELKNAEQEQYGRVREDEVFLSVLFAILNKENEYVVSSLIVTLS